MTDGNFRRMIDESRQAFDLDEPVRGRPAHYRDDMAAGGRPSPSSSGHESGGLDDDRSRHASSHTVVAVRCWLTGWRFACVDGEKTVDRLVRNGLVKRNHRLPTED